MDALPSTRGSAFPFSFSAKERQEMEADIERVTRGIEAMRSTEESVSEIFPGQGIVSRPVRTCSRCVRAD